MADFGLAIEMLTDGASMADRYATSGPECARKAAGFDATAADLRRAAAVLEVACKITPDGYARILFGLRNTGGNGEVIEQVIALRAALEAE